MSEVVVVERNGKIASIILNRPDKLNALNREVFEAFDAALIELEHDDDVAVVIIKGAGRAFCVGYDVGTDNPERSKLKSVTADRDRLEVNVERWLRVWDFPKPVIGQVHGYALAGGTQLLTCCDIVITAEDAKFGFPSVPLGGGYVGPMWTHVVGAQRSKLMDFTAGSQIDGKRAVEWGMATLAFPAERLDEETLDIARKIARTPADILRLKKKAINRVIEGGDFRTSVLNGALWDSIIHQADGVKLTSQKISELGVRGAVDWFNSQDV
ncbi:enoyl-CoA hydratase-related protein [Hoeflea sp.]|uniref:enoyl-CoA hydratase-related protein n=1 Tax=Hoeflea sp. TaxID=1940281 RepID=UPI003A8EA3B3